MNNEYPNFMNVEFSRHPATSSPSNFVGTSVPGCILSLQIEAELIYEKFEPIVEPVVEKDKGLGK